MTQWGSASYTWHGPAVAKVARDAAFDALQREAERILAISQNLVPWDSGTLGRSGDVIDKRGQGFIEITYGKDAPYAAVQHENRGGRFSRYTKSGTGDHYLSKPLKANAKALLRAVANAVSNRLGGA